MALYKNRYPSSETLPYGLKGNERVIDPKWMEKYLADKAAAAQKNPEELLRQNRWPSTIPADPAMLQKGQAEKEKVQPSGLKRKMQQSNIFNFSKDEAFNRMYLDTDGYESVQASEEYDVPAQGKRISGSGNGKRSHDCVLPGTLIDAQGNKMVEYAYGAWGKPIIKPYTAISNSAQEADTGAGQLILREVSKFSEAWKTEKEEALTAEDKAAGITVVMYGGKPVYDYSIVINNVFSDVSSLFASHDVNADGNQALSLGEMAGNLDDLVWFMNQVNHQAPWDLKIDQSWEETIGNVRMPKYAKGNGEKFLVNGYLMDREDLGNITYGYLGSSMGISPEILYLMGGVAKKVNMAAASPEEIAHALDVCLQDEKYYGDDKNDHVSIEVGIQWYQNR